MTPRPRHYFALLVCTVGWLALHLLDAPPVEATIAPVEAAQTAQDAPGGTREAWARDVLAGLGNATPSAATVALMVAWQEAEDVCTHACGYSNAWERHNPLNTTQTGFSETGTINGDGVKGYATYQDGVSATLQTLSYGYYTEIVAGLQTNDPERALRGLYVSPWGTSATNVERIWRGM